MGPRMREDKRRGGRFANPPYVGITERDVGGQPQGLPLWRRGAGYSRENAPMEKGVHQGRPYVGRVRWRKGGGQVSNLHPWVLPNRG